MHQLLWCTQSLSLANIQGTYLVLYVNLPLISFCSLELSTLTLHMKSCLSQNDMKLSPHTFCARHISSPVFLSLTSFWTWRCPDSVPQSCVGVCEDCLFPSLEAGLMERSSPGGHENHLPGSCSEDQGEVPGTAMTSRLTILYTVWLTDKPNLLTLGYHQMFCKLNYWSQTNFWWSWMNNFCYNKNTPLMSTTATRGYSTINPLVTYISWALGHLLFVGPALLLLFIFLWYTFKILSLS